MNRRRNGKYSYFVSNGGSINKACKEYWVPRATLQYGIHNGQPNKTGRKPYLTYNEAGELVKYVKYKSRTGHCVKSRAGYKKRIQFLSNI